MLGQTIINGRIGTDVITKGPGVGNRTPTMMIESPAWNLHRMNIDPDQYRPMMLD